MKKAVVLIGASAAFLVCGVLVLFAVLGELVRLPELAQPKFGYTGQWHRHYPFGWKEAYLPPASEVRKHHKAWEATTNDFSTRVYIARLGHAERQLNFRVSTNMTHNMPLGDYHYTIVDFDYVDPTNGIYHFNWSLRGKHDPGFLRFDGRERLYELTLDNTPEEYPPSLSIEAIEGIKPWEN